MGKRNSIGRRYKNKCGSILIGVVPRYFEMQMNLSASESRQGQFKFVKKRSHSILFPLQFPTTRN